MHSHAAKERLIYPVAVLLAAGLVSVPHSPGSATTGPRLTEFAAVQLQAEVTALVTGIADAAEATTPGAAASILTGRGPEAAATGCTYPCTIFDKFLESLPEDIRYALLPVVFSVAWVIGLVMAPVVLVTSALFGWPHSLGPAAAADPETTPGITPETLPTPAQVAAVTGDRPSTPVDDSANDAVAAENPNAGDDLGTGVRAHRDIRVVTNAAVTTEAVQTPADTTVGTATAPDAPVAAPDAPVGSPDAPLTSDDAPAEAADLPAEDANAPAVSAIASADIADVPGEATTTEAEPAPFAARSAEAGGGSAQADNSDSAPKRARVATRSVR